MRKWFFGVLASLIILGSAAILFQLLQRPDKATPCFQVTDVSISKPTISDMTHHIFAGYILDSYSFYFTASESVTCKIAFNNHRYPVLKTVTLTYYSVNDTEVVDDFILPPYAENSRSFDLLTGQSFSGSIEISGSSMNDMYVQFTYTNYTQSIDYSFNLVNSGSDGYAVVELRSDGMSVWSNKYTLASGVSEKVTGTVKIPDKDEHTLQVFLTQQG